jgi:2,3-bisphosphoglycerate-dependent phosphoglycerate mutase
LHLYLIRHAESENNAQPEHLRVEDPGITPRGVEQAEFLARWLAEHPLDQVITSPFRRALQTVAPLFALKKHEVEVCCDVVERGGCYRGWHPGNWEGGKGFSADEIAAFLPGVTVDARITAAGWWANRPRETDAEAELRAEQTVAKLSARFAASKKRIAIITHAEFQRIMLEKMLSAQSIAADSLGPICNAGITYVTLHDGRWKLQWFNAVTHMPSQLVSGAKG